MGKTNEAEHMMEKQQDGKCQKLQPDSLSVEQDEKNMEWIPQPGRANHRLRQQHATMLVASVGET